MSHLADTNVLGELARPAPSPTVLAWAKGQRTIRVSVVTLEEIHYGLSWKPNLRVERWFEQFFAAHVVALPITAEIAARVGRLRGTLQQQGETRTQADLLIAATALLHDLTLVTRT